MRLASLVAVVVLTASGTAWAQPALTPPSSVGPVSPTSPPAARRSGGKHASTAVAISLGATLGSLAVIGLSVDSGSATLPTIGVIGLYFAPSTGQWYAGRSGGLGLIARGVSGLVMVGSAFHMIGETHADVPSGQRGAEVMFWVGAGMWVGSTIYDHVAAGRAAQSWNRRHGVTLTPTVVSTGAARAPGMSLQLSF